MVEHGTTFKGFDFHSRLSRTRTCNLRLRRAALCQLSYKPKQAGLLLAKDDGLQQAFNTILPAILLTRRQPINLSRFKRPADRTAFAPMFKSANRPKL